MQFVGLLHDANVIAFMLLFFRFGSLFMVTPIFSHQNIPMQFKATMALFFTIVFYNSLPPLTLPVSTPTLVIAILSEIIFGLSVGIVLQIAFNVITFAGGQISYMMGFSLASAIDPQTGVSMPIVSQFLSLLALMTLFALNLHHWIILFVDASLSSVPLGGFVMTQDLFNYTVHATSRMFLVGFMIAFPIIALSWLADTIFGMLMKTMPQFNLLVIGFPIKIAVAFVVIIATLTATLLIVKGEMKEAFNMLEMFF